MIDGYGKMADGYGKMSERHGAIGMSEPTTMRGYYDETVTVTTATGNGASITIVDPHGTGDPVNAVLTATQRLALARTLAPDAFAVVDAAVARFQCYREFSDLLNGDQFCYERDETLDNVVDAYQHATTPGEGDEG